MHGSSVPRFCHQWSMGSPFVNWHNRIRLGRVVGLILTGACARAEVAFQLYDPGQEKIVNYDKYGVFEGTGTAQYRYYIKDRQGLADAVGEGIYPNVTALHNDPHYQKMQSQKLLEGRDWDYLNADNVQAGFFKWASTHDEPNGIKQFYTAMM